MSNKVMTYFIALWCGKLYLTLSQNNSNELSLAATLVT